MPASPGIVIGPVHLLLWEVPEVPNRIVPDESIPEEIARLHDSIEKAKQRLMQVKHRAERHAGPEEAAICEVQIAILSDVELISSVETLIRQNLGAERSEEHTSELQSPCNLVCRLLLDKKKKNAVTHNSI